MLACNLASAANRLSIWHGVEFHEVGLVTFEGLLQQYNLLVLVNENATGLKWLFCGESGD